MRKPRYRVYGRYPGPEQGKGSSEERQLDMEQHRQRAEELGAELVEIPYIDRGKSGFYGDNLEAELGRIKAEIESGIIVRGEGPHMSQSIYITRPHVRRFHYRTSF
jgi:hypothetical protein